MSDRVHFAGLTLMLPAGWLDIGADLPAGTPPTLGKEDGVGVIQFSVGKYRSGVRPNIDVDALEEMLEEFAEERGLGMPSSTTARRGEGKNRFFGGDFVLADERICVWCVTNGSDVALVTYVTREPKDPRVGGELIEAAAVVSELDFE